MNKFLIVIFGILFLGPPATGAEAIRVETLHLQYKAASEIIPLIEPFLPDQAVIKGDGQQILVKTTPSNLKEIEKLINQLDTPLRQLQITVSVDPGVLQHGPIAPANVDNSADTGTDNRITIEKPAPPTTRTWRTEGRQIAPGTQTIQVLEKNWAMIRTGQAVPVVSRTRNPDGTVTETITYQQLNRGLRIRPELRGQTVVLEVQPFYEAESRRGGGRQIYFQAATTVRARLGQWLALAASSGKPLTRNAAEQQSYRTERQTGQDTALYLKIDLVP